MKRTTLILIALGAVFLVTAVPGATRLYTDWLWFGEVGFERVFLTGWTWRIALFLGGFGLALAFLFLNLRRPLQGVFPPFLVKTGPEVAPVDVAPTLRRLVLPAAALLGLGASAPVAHSWLALLQYFQQTPFGVVDPVLGRDVAFYIYTLPVLTALFAFLVPLSVMATFLVVVLYFLRGDLIFKPPVLRLEPSAGWHVAILLALTFGLLGAQAWLVRIPELLLSQDGAFAGATYSDLHASLPAYRVIAVVALGCSVLVLVGAFLRRTVPYAIVAVAAYVVVAGLGRVAFPSLVQRFVVAPTELTRETPQIESHVDMTRLAWGLDAVEVRNLRGEARLTIDDLQNNSATVENVRLWDREPLLQTFGQLQEIRTYYDFRTVVDDRYWINGRYRQVLLSPRELNVSSLPQRTFINQYLTYTHGMGVTLAPVNQVTTEGLPVLFIKDLPPVSGVDLHVTRPQIYYGQLTDNFVFVNTNRQEFDYPAADTIVFRPYTGQGGVPVGGFLRRALIAARFGGITAFLSGDIRRESRILYYRNVAERAARALPFLLFDQDPYLVIRDSGELVWILDAYTASPNYPYATRSANGMSYMRNSVKVVVDAYHGEVRAYIADAADPMIRTFDRVFPGILHPMEEMPADVRAHLRYPEDLYRIQTDLYTIYHMAEPETFYHREDQWQIPTLGTERAEPFMRRIIMRLPDEPDPEFIFVTQFTPRGRDNLAAWMVARSDGDNYGQLVVYRFPRQSLVFGPLQIMNRINQDTDIARQISLWDQRGSEVIRGELLVIPIEEALIYVQPLYLRAEGGQIPELKRVIVAYETQVVMEETLDQALAVLFGLAPPSPIDDPGASAAARPPAPTLQPGVEMDPEVFRQMQEQYERALREIERLGELLRQMQRRGGGEG
ncbi:MAG: UPF0182 family protein [Longimicrobiales bacterium]|nr:UPF0182 family protein [Longimicrobiales bacterium]